MSFASYAAAIAGLPPTVITPMALAAIVLLTFINVLGVKPSSVMTSLFTLLKLAALGILIVAGLWAILGGRALPAPVLLPLVHGTATISFAGALVPVLFAYGGWQQTNFVAEEMVDASRNLPRALLWGVAIVLVVYLLANVVYLKVLGVGGLADSTAPAADTMQVIFGPAGRTFIAVGIALSTVGFLNLAICANARVYQAMARDRIFFDAFAQLHPRFRTPVVALVAQGAWAIVLLLSGTYGELLDYVVFGDWIFFGLTAATLFYFRRRDAQAGAASPEFVTPAWQLSVILFVAAAIYVVAGSVMASPGNALRGTALILLGVPLYLWRRRAGLENRGGNG
jgi:APA family basic amino acid/polyamine antiporter